MRLGLALTALLTYGCATTDLKEKYKPIREVVDLCPLPDSPMYLWRPNAGVLTKMRCVADGDVVLEARRVKVEIGVPIVTEDLFEGGERCAIGAVYRQTPSSGNKGFLDFRNGLYRTYVDSLGEWHEQAVNACLLSANDTIA